MKKEQYQSSSSFPIDIIFIPEALQITFTQKIKFQIAFYRNTKLCKSTPSKFHKCPQSQPSPTSSTSLPLPLPLTPSQPTPSLLKLQPQHLQFCTTLCYDQHTQTFQSKIINVQVVYQADGAKEMLEGKIDLREVVLYQGGFHKSGLAVQVGPDVKLYYGVVGKIPNFRGGDARAKETSPLTVKKQPVIQKQLSPLKRKAIQPTQPTQSPVSIRKTAQPTQSPQTPLQQPPPPPQNPQTQIPQLPKSLHPHPHPHPHPSQDPEPEALPNKSLSPNQKNSRSTKQKQLQNELQTSNKKMKVLSDKLAETIKKYDEVVEDSMHLKGKLKLCESSLLQKNKEIGDLEKLLERVTEEKNTLLSTLAKSSNQEPEITKKLNQQIQKQTNEINVLKEVNNEYKIKVAEIRKLEGEAVSKYQESEKKNIKLVENIEEISYKLEKCERELDKNIKKVEKLEKQLEETEKANSIQSPSQDNLKAKEAQILKLTRNLETKEEVIRMLKKQTEHKKNEQESDISALRKQNKDLKDEIDRLKDPKKDSSFLELQILNERLKKEATQAKREEKKMLTEKADAQSKCKDMHQQIVRLKESIGRMLNIVQEEGSGDLFTLVADCVS